MANGKRSAKSNGNAAGSLDLVLDELETIKRLLIAGLAQEGVKQEQLASILQASQPTVSRMFPGGLPKPASETGNTSTRGRKR